MNPLQLYLHSKLQERQQAGNLRSLKIQRAPVDFFSNDYLGLATTGALAQLMRRSADGDDAATGSTGSRLLSGNSAAAEALERTIAAFHNAEAALLFNSGYDANVGLLSAIIPRTATVLYDELCHASIIDGIRLSPTAHRYKYRHNSLDDLAGKLQKHTGNGPLVVVTESIFSMDGDMAPLAEMAALCATHNAQLIVDEAHATGIYGPCGEGLVCALGLADAVFARVHTYGKALGCHGAAVVGSALLRDYLINFARPFIYTTALPGHSVRAIQCAYQYLSAPAFTHQPLHALIAYFRQCIQQCGHPGWADSSSPIQAFIAASNHRAKAIAAALQAAGLQVNAILHPTVPLGMERLRVCLHVYNTREEVDRLFGVVIANNINVC